MLQDLMPLQPVEVQSEPVANVVAQGPLSDQMDSFAQQFDDARVNRDPVKAFDLSVKASGTPVGEAAAHTAALYAKGAEDFNKLNAPIENAGGLQTPEGRKEAIKVFQSTRDNPKYGDALIAILLGQKDAAYRALTGGKEFNKIVLDQKGMPIKVHTNEAGDLIDVQDIGSGKMLTPEEYQQRGVGKYTSYENTLDYKTKGIQTEANAKAWANSQSTNNNWAAFGQAIKPVVDRIKTIGNQPWFQELPAEKQSELLRFTGGAIGSASSASKNTSNLGQLQSMASANEGKAIDKNILSSFGLAGTGWEWKGGMAVNTKTGQSKSISELNQIQNSTNSSNELNNSFKQTQESLATFLKTSGLDANKQAQVLEFLKMSNDVGQEMLRMTREHGVPSYLYLPGQMSSVDQKSRVLAQAEQLGAIGDLTQNFAAYANGMKASADKGDILPAPAAAESGFTQTPFYKQTVDATKRRMNDIVMSTPVQQSATQATPVAPKAIPKAKVGNEPPKGIPAGSIKIGRTPDGRTVYQSQDGKKHVED